MNVEDHVAVVGHHTLTVFRTTAQLHKLTGNRAARHRDHFDRQREIPQNVDLLGGVRDADELIRHGSDDFFAGQRRATAFDHLHVAVDFIRAINVNAQTVHFVEVENGDAEAFQLFRGSIGAGNRTLDLPLHRAQRIDKVCRRGPRTNTDNGTRLYVLESGPSYCFFQFILRHDRFACGVKTQGAL